MLIDYIDSDPDQPVIVGQLYQTGRLRPQLARGAALPGNRYLAGLRGAGCARHARQPATPGRHAWWISASLASDHGILRSI
jgi:type VI secretion system secreted protein VgrG